MKSEEAETPSSAEQLREALIVQLRELGAVRTEAVEAAVRAVPRHVFVPQVSLSEAYAPERAVITKKDEDGVDVSSVSAARIQALMLEQAEIRPGMRVLEIGSGGYNAALIAELVGGKGEVTSIDIDPDAVDRARRFLAEAGYGRVNVLLADGEEGEPVHAPFDRIIVTVGAWDIPPAWVDQLAEGGRIVVPLRVRCLTRSVALEREGGHLVSRNYELCGFVPMQGVGERRMQLVVLHDEPGDEVGLKLDDGDRVDAEGLRTALAQPPVEVWSGVTIGGMEPFDGLDLWLATAVPDFARLAATPSARDRGIVAAASPMGISTLIDKDSFAYRKLRPTSPERTTFEFGAFGHGPDAQAVADQLVEHIRNWDREHRSGRAVFMVHPAGTSDDQLPAGRVVDKRHTRVTISWP
ncbi:methyltransferase, FxLD system [Streptomyces sp. NPDC057654]|uniref:methyltransferase, FxLD system n=1 Tax=Streptomyces sp. NPDC057654 TaxID=3346196 RepID=UPI003699BAB7